MPLTNDIRKTFTDPTPLYFAAGVLDKIRTEAPGRLAAVRATDPREVQEKVATRAKETQARMQEVLGTLDTDIKKLREQAQSYALQGVGIAAEYAVKARERYDEFAQRGRGAVRTWRGEEGTQITVEREPVTVVAEPPAQGAAGAQPRAAQAGPRTTGTTPRPAAGRAATPGAAKANGGTPSSQPKAKPAAKKTPQAKAKPGGAAKANGGTKQPPKSGS
jgi:phage-related tail protein